MIDVSVHVTFITFVCIHVQLLLSVLLVNVTQ